MSEKSDAWTFATKRIIEGMEINGRYEVAVVEDTRFRLKRLATGKPVNISRRLIERIWEATKDGGTVARRENGPSGISYTVAIEDTVVLALGLEREGETWKRNT